MLIIICVICNGKPLGMEKNFTVYRSSAGSGKTFTLVKEYLVLALSDAGPSPQSYRHILAVTFTNKAAAEMKERIIRALKDLAEEDYSTLPPGSITLLNILLEAPALNQPVKITEQEIREERHRLPFTRRHIFHSQIHRILRIGKWLNSFTVINFTTSGYHF